jgi:hypothetical protein
MLEQALRRQVWIMLLDDTARPLPIVMPSDVPEEPDPEDIHGLAEFLNCVALDFGNATIVLTLERPGPAELMDRDRRWLRLLREACVMAGFPFRGPFLLLGDELRQLPPDDYVGIPWVYYPDDEYDDQGPF